MSEQLDWLARNVHECLTYDKLTGVFTWKTRPASHFKTCGAHKAWNSKHAGKRAGHTNHHPENKYVVIRVNGKSYKAHRLAVLMETGEMPPSEVDHVNGDQSDNRVENLRCVSRGENSKNLPKRKGREFIGISLQKGKFRSRVTVNGKEIALGTFTTLEQAQAAREKALAVYGFGVNHGR